MDLYTVHSDSQGVSASVVMINSYIITAVIPAISLLTLEVPIHT